MADDASYMSFLNKANADTSASKSQSTSQSKSAYDPTTVTNTSLPAPLRDLSDKYTYTSETDAPFVPVVLAYSGSALPSAADFANCLKHTKASAVEELSVKDWDPRGEYTEVIGKVEAAGIGDGGAKVYRVEVSSTRAEYYVVTLLGEGKGLVGAKVEAVES